MKYISLRITVILFFISNLSFTQNHPGNLGEDAPGGEVVKIESLDIKMHGVIYRPEKTNKISRLPAIIVIHGWTPYNVRGGESHTYFAKDISKEGFITLGITLRGWNDTGGRDDCGLKQSTDIVNAIEWLSKQPGVDPENIGILGQSLGGQVALTAAAKSHSVKAIVAYFPVTDFKLWGETTSLDILDDYINGMCAQEGTSEDRSPRLMSDKINASVLFMHGDQDNNTIIDHSILMYLEMLKQNKDVELFIAKNGGHGSYGPGWENHFKYMIDYFRRTFK